MDDPRLCCGLKAHTTDCRPSNGRYRRRRSCSSCGKRWTTMEVRDSEGRRGMLPVLLNAAERKLVEVLRTGAVRLELPPEPRAKRRRAPQAPTLPGLLAP